MVLSVQRARDGLQLWACMLEELLPPLPGPSLFDLPNLNFIIQTYIYAIFLLFKPSLTNCSTPRSWQTGVLYWAVIWTFMCSFSLIKSLLKYGFT